MALTPEEKAVLAKIGKRGGKAAAASMTPEARKQRAANAIKTRWDRARAAAAEATTPPGEAA